MEVLGTLTSNHVLNIAIVSFAAAQLLKILFTVIFTGKLSIRRIFEAGGMPSSHSAMTCSLVVAIARTHDFSSPLLAVAICFATVVMYDAMGVRRAAGEQAKVLNTIIFDFSFFTRHKPKKTQAQDEAGNADNQQTRRAPTSKELKEFLGHTPLEVLAGCLLGIIIAVLMPVA